MGSLLYREDVETAFDRLSDWWAGEDIGRPAMLLTAKREKPVENIPIMATPDGWETHYPTLDFEYRVNLAQRGCIHTHYLAEAVPEMSPDLGPNCLALYLGCRGVERPGTVWFESCIDRPEEACFTLDPEDFYWDFTLRLAKEQLRVGDGKFLTSFPDLIEGLDTLAAMRGTQNLLVDLVERPEWVHRSLKCITDRYFECYDTLYNLIKGDRGGSHFWAWAPGRVSKLQCDFSAMISPEMFGEFMVPVLKSMTERLDHTMFHWDGPGAVPHHDHLLSIPGISTIQWTPGAGAEPVADRQWWPLYHKTFEAGKNVALLGVAGLNELKALKQEFGGKFKRFLIRMRAKDLLHAHEVLDLVAE